MVGLFSLWGWGVPQLFFAWKLRKTTHPNSHGMQKCFQEVMKHKNQAENHGPATSQESLCAEVVAFEYFLKVWPSCRNDPCMVEDKINQAQLACLVKAGTLLACRDTGRVLLALCISKWGIVAWNLEVVGHDAADEPCFAGQFTASSISFEFVTDVEAWVEIPFKSRLVNAYGPVVFQKVAPPIPLLLARVQEGLTLTVHQCKLILAHFQAKFPADKKRAAFYAAVIGLCLDSQEEIDNAMKKSKEEFEDDKSACSDLTDYEDLVALLEENQNVGDPDLKAEKEKLKRKRSAKNLASAKKKLDHIQGLKRKPKAKAKNKFAKAFARRQKKDVDAEMQAVVPARPEPADAAASSVVPLDEPEPGVGAAASSVVPLDEPEPGVGAAASSVQAPLEIVPAVEPPPKNENAPEKDRAEAGSRTKQYKSPSELLSAISPPECTFTLNYNDHRWVASWKDRATCAAWRGYQKHKSCSRSFNKDLNWQEKLEEIHKLSWEKFGIAFKNGDIKPDADFQEAQPRVIPQEVLEGLKKVVADMPPPRSYSRV